MYGLVGFISCFGSEDLKKRTWVVLACYFFSTWLLRNASSSQTFCQWAHAYFSVCVWLFPCLPSDNHRLFFVISQVGCRVLGQNTFSEVWPFLTTRFQKTSPPSVVRSHVKICCLTWFVLASIWLSLRVTLSAGFKGRLQTESSSFFKVVFWHW